MAPVLSFPWFVFLLIICGSSALPVRSPALPERDAPLVCQTFTTGTIFEFLIANFVTHCFTIKSRPGESAVGSVIAALSALMAPGSGVQRAWEALVRRARFFKGNSLERAVRAGAMIMVIRDPLTWEPSDGDELIAVGITDNRLRPPQGDLRNEHQGAQVLKYTLARPLCTQEQLPIMSWPIESTSKHGAWSLPKGYTFATVPSNAQIVPLPRTDVRSLSHNASDHEERVSRSSSTLSSHQQGRQTRADDATSAALHRTANVIDKPVAPRTAFNESVNISSSFNGPRALAAMVSLASASYTLYKTKADHIERYGYAAFDLAVTPYLFMSLLNLVASIVTPDYPSQYLVYTAEMAEAERRGALFDGVVGALVSIDEAGLHDVPTSGSDVYANSQLDSEDSHGTPEPVRFGDRSYCFQRAEREDEEYVRLLICTPFACRDPSYFMRKTSMRLGEVGEAICLYGSILLGLIPLLIVGGLSNWFDEGHSTQAQRGWMMSWLVSGFYFGPVLGKAVDGVYTMFLVRQSRRSASRPPKRTRERIPERADRRRFILFWLIQVTGMLMLVGIFAAPIGGFVTAIMMMTHSQDCQEI